MNPDPPDEPDFRGQTLSPVSPKPLHFPKPSNIPLLEDQMDPAFNGSTTAVNPAQNSNSQDVTATQQQSTEEPADAAVEQDKGEEPVADESSAQGLQNGVVATGTNGNVATVTSDSPGPSVPPSMPIVHSDFDSAASNGTVPQSEPAPVVTNGHIDNSTGSLASPAQQISDHSSNGQEQISVFPSQGTPQAGGVDIQALLDNLSASVVAAPTTSGTAPALSFPTPPAVSSSESTASGLAHTSASAASQTSTAPLPAFAGLPPRPPPQNNPNNVLSESDLRSFHLHDQQHQPQPLSTPKYAPPSVPSLRPPGSVPPPAPAAGAPGTSLSSNHLPPPPVPTFQQQQVSPTAHVPQDTTSAASYRQRDALEGHTNIDDYGDDDEQRWGPEVQRKYDAFLEDERMYVTRGEWHNFPANSRLFIGNLPTEKVTKRDLFHVFHKYGKLAQVSIKQAYGFIQYLEARDCLSALQAEQGVSVRGRKIHLEISKPQRSNQSHNTTGSGDGRAKANQRARSPDHPRGGSGNQRGADRYRGGGGDARNRDSQRGRDDYRPGRSPSPRSRGSRRSPNRRRRSRSRSPYTGYRSPSPRRGGEDDCPLPRRAPQDVPEVQVIVKDDPDRAFVNYVEKGFEARGIKSNVLILSPRLSEASVVRRQIIEGVLAVMKIDRIVQATQKFQLSIFDRSGGANSVKFEEYADLALNICVELVLRAKQNAARASSQYYGLPLAPPAHQHGTAQSQPPHHQQQQQQQPYTQYSPHPPTSSQFPALDTSSLQQLLGRAQHTTPQQSPQPPYGGPQQFPPASDLSRLLASAGGAQNQHSQSPYQSPPQNQLPISANLGSLAGLLGGQGPTPSPQQHQRPQQTPPQQPPSQPQQKPDMANLMAMLGRYK